MTSYGTPAHCSKSGAQLVATQSKQAGDWGSVTQFMRHALTPHATMAEEQSAQAGVRP